MKERITKSHKETQAGGIKGLKEMGARGSTMNKASLLETGKKEKTKKTDGD